MHAKLWVDESNQEVPVGAGPFIIGRADGCNLILKGNGKASRRHAEIKFVHGRYAITDLGSHNGTVVNGQKVMEQVLSEGDTIVIGGVTMRFISGVAPAAPAPRPAAPPPPRAAAPQQPPSFRPAAPPPPPPGNFMGGPAAPGNEGTQFVDMGELLNQGNEGTAFIDMNQIAGGGGGGTGLFNPGSPEKKNKLLMVAGGGVVVVVLLLLVLLMLPSGPVAAVFPTGTEYTRLKVEVGSFSYIALEHTEIQVEKKDICAANSNAQSLNEIVVKGLKEGETLVAVRVDPTTWYLLPVIVTRKEEWPPRWTEDDRLRAAEKLKREADSLYSNRESVTDALVPAYYRYEKILRLYANCQFPPPAPLQESTERYDELGVKIVEMEKNLVRSFWREFRLKNAAAAKVHLEDLLVLFPEDGSDGDPMERHGNAKKHHQYFLLSQKFSQMRR